MGLHQITRAAMTIRACRSACLTALMLLFSGALHAEDTGRPTDEELALELGEPDGAVLWPDLSRTLGTPLDPIVDLSRTLPKERSLSGWSLPQGYTDAKKGLYRKVGLKIGGSYQSLYQKSTETLTGTDTAWGGWLLVEAAWTPLNRGQPWQGTLVASLDARHVIDSDRNTAPGTFFAHTGSLWPTDGAFLEWSMYPAVLFWEQRFRKDSGGQFRSGLRVGQISAPAVLDTFRYEDVRTSFSSTAMSFIGSVVPAGPPGLGAAFKWWPIPESNLYVIGMFNDINAVAGEFDWSALFDEGEIFAGAEVGYDWQRSENDFDHVHLTVWYADEASQKVFPTESGWGFKVHGSKQWGQVVGFGNYTYNDAVGGGNGLTNSRQAISAGVARNDPFGIDGEVAVAGAWSEPIDGNLRDQYGLEAYWKLLLMSNLWITPGVQLIIDPTFNPTNDSFAIYQLKFRLFL